MHCISGIYPDKFVLYKSIMGWVKYNWMTHNNFGEIKFKLKWRHLASEPTIWNQKIIASTLCLSQDLNSLICFSDITNSIAVEPFGFLDVDLHYSFRGPLIGSIRVKQRLEPFIRPVFKGCNGDKCIGYAISARMSRSFTPPLFMRFPI